VVFKGERSATGDGGFVTVEVGVAVALGLGEGVGV